MNISATHRVEGLMIWAACIVLVLSLLSKLSYLHWANRLPTDIEPGAARKELTSGTWHVERKPVLLQFDHYKLRYGIEAAQEWAALVPHDGLLHLWDGSSWTPHTLSLFHQLRCLDVLRAQYQLPLEARDIPRAQHCMNYLRQMILCRGDMHLETFRADRFSAENVDCRGTYRCRDFRAVYDALEKTHEEYVAWLAGTNATLHGV